MDKFRPTAIPLVTVDPYFSIWSFTDNLYDDVTRHWSGRRCQMTGFLTVDGKNYRFLGKIQGNNEYYFCEPEHLLQKSATVEATKSAYVFENDLLSMTLVFRTPVLTDDLYLMSRPVGYISYEIEYKDGKSHNTSVYFDICSELCVEKNSDIVEFGKTEYSVYCGKGNRDVLERRGDEIRIDWGYVHIAFPGAQYKYISGFDKRDYFEYDHEIKGIDGNRPSCDDSCGVCAIKEYVGSAKITDFLCVAYEDFYSIEFFGEKLKGYWTTNGDSFEDVVRKAIAEYDVINKKCNEFDIEFRKNGEKISKKYADIICLVYRQIIGAHKLVERNGKLLFFSKECYSNGDMATVDITYPSAPMFLLYQPDLIEGMLNPVFEYVEGNHGWIYDFAPHDLGIYPKANGQEYGREQEGEEYFLSRQMPVEECGNMILCVMMLCEARGNYSYAKEHLRTLEKWANYLVKNGYDPESQLCTDDFAGHLAHNCNLSVKGILAIAAFGKILENCQKDGSEYTSIAKGYAKKWKEEAKSGDHYGLTFENKDSWSIKYNLVMDKLLNLDIFDRDIFEEEVKFYKTKISKYALALDSRSDWAKSDWQMWSTCLTDDIEYRDLIIERMWNMICEMQERVPFSDWYFASKPEMERFQGRSVQGGLFMPLLF